MTFYWKTYVTIVKNRKCPTVYYPDAQNSVLEE